MALIKRQFIANRDENSQELSPVGIIPRIILGGI